jgi:hypothetical protein
MLKQSIVSLSVSLGAHEFCFNRKRRQRILPSRIPSSFPSGFSYFSLFFITARILIAFNTFLVASRNLYRYVHFLFAPVAALVVTASGSLATVFRRSEAL